MQVMGVLDAMPSSNLKPENEDAVSSFYLCLVLQEGLQDLPMIVLL